jgi:hypothetical protein
MGEFKSIIDFGADPTGVRCSAAAIEAAQVAGDFVYAPKARFRLSRTVHWISGRTWRSDGALFFHDDDTATIFSAVDLERFELLGHLQLEGLLTTNVDTGEHGLRLVNPHRVHIDRITATKFKGSALLIEGDDYGTKRGDELSIGSLALYENRKGFDIKAGAGAEYVSIGNVQAVENIYAGTISAGNCHIHGGNITDNYYGPEVIGGVPGDNHGHGGFHAININHNTYWNLRFHNVTNGFMVDACNVYADNSSTGKILIEDSKGVAIRGGHIDAPIENSGTVGKNMLQDCYMPGSLTTVSGLHPASLMRGGNFNASGLWPLNTF